MTHTKSIRTSKSGLSTVFGMIVVVAIMMTVIIPLFLYINNVNNLYNETAEYMRAADQKRELEKLKMYIYPNTNGSYLNIQMQNVCVLPVRVTNIWVTINNTLYLLSDIPEIQHDVEPATFIMAGFPLPAGEKRVKVELTTARGNQFAAENNPIWVSEEGWGWDPFSINIVMAGPNGWLRRTIYVEYIGPNLDYEWNNTMEVTENVIGGYASVSIGLKDVGDYMLIIIDNRYGPVEIDRRTISVSFAMPSPWVYIPEWVY